MMPMPEGDSAPAREPGHFPATCWTAVIQARDGGDETAFAALSQLCAAYWTPVYAYIRGTTADAHDAEDLTQGFFADLLRRDFLAGVTAEKGRFRAFLLASVKHYLANDRRKRAAGKRGSGLAPLPLDFPGAEAALQGLGTDRLAPDILFERQWALALLDSVLRALEQEYRDSGRGALFDALKGTLTPAGATASLKELSAKLGMQEGSLKVAAHRLRKRYRAALHAAVAETLAEQDDLAEEIAHLIQVFAGR